MHRGSHPLFRRELRPQVPIEDGERVQTMLTRGGEQTSRLSRDAPAMGDCPAMVWLPSRPRVEAQRTDGNRASGAEDEDGTAARRRCMGLEYGLEPS
jgi:hypothetical protein